MDREQWTREHRNSGASWPALLGVYAILVGTLAFSASSML